MNRGTCTVPDCGQPRYKGKTEYCVKHHRRAQRHNGDVHHVDKRGLPVRPLDERFWEKVDKTASSPDHVPHLDGCWVWTATRNRSGYGRIGMSGGVTRFAHRVSYELNVGPIPSGLLVLHRCDNPPCVRPDHLFLGTDADNIHDAMAKGRLRGQFKPKSQIGMVL